MHLKDLTFFSSFRFLTPMPPGSALESQCNTKTIHSAVLSDKSTPNPTLNIDGVSPSNVSDVCLTVWNNFTGIPSWYAKGADVDELIDQAQTLDWLADSGDPDETYIAPSDENDMYIALNNLERSTGCEEKQNTSMNTLPRVDSNADSMVPSLPDLFGGHESSSSFQLLTKKALSSSNLLLASVCGSRMDEHLQVFDTPMEERDFVSTLLECSNEDNNNMLHISSLSPEKS